MNQKINMQYLKTILISTIITLIGMYGFYNYAPFSIDKLGEQLLGTSITTILGTDTLKNSRTTINDNFTALNAGKVEISTTTLPLITNLPGLTSAANLATVGTIGTGIWQGTDVGVAYGGTGASTLTAYGVLLGNGTSAISSVSGLGTSGQFLTSNGAGAAPTWQSSSVDTTQNFTWTGNHYFNTGSSTFNGITALNGFTTADDLYIGSSSMSVYPTASSSIATKGYVDNLFTLTVASSTIASSTSAVAGNQTSYTKTKEISTSYGGNIEVEFKILRVTNYGYTVYGRIYVNGVAVGTERSCTEDEFYLHYKETINVSPGDLIQLYSRTSNGTYTYSVKDFNINAILTSGFTVNQ